MLQTPFFKASIPLLRDKSLKVSYQAKWVLLYLYDRQEMNRFPVAYSIIGQDLGGMPVMKVRRVIDELKSQGFIKVTARKSFGLVYQVSLVSVHSEQSQTTTENALKPCQNTVIDPSEQSRLFIVNNITDSDTLRSLGENNFLSKRIRMSVLAQSLFMTARPFQPIPRDQETITFLSPRGPIGLKEKLSLISGC